MIKKFEFNTNLLKKLGYSDYIDHNVFIYNVSTAYNPQNNTLIFVNKLNNDMIKTLKNIKNSILILNKEDSHIEFEGNCIFHVERPRKEYAKILKFILDNQAEVKRNYLFKDGYYIGENVKIGKNTVIEPFVFIDNDTVIGDNCVIKTGAKIRSNTIIKDKCVIKENSVIGSDGFGVERDLDGTTYKIPHLGGVVVGESVEIGAMSVIAQGTIEPTEIEDYVKIDDCVFVAHNCKIRKGTFIIANAEVSGSVEIGKNCWISPNVCIKDGLKIGDNSILGMGTVVLNEVKENSVMIGNPAKVLKIR
ncbi:MULTISPECIES: UDP-3-O-(3-hydroxymyristoyl)glucosamine N-acyltransferase [Clostridium]|uniref:UDP-3-O-(3-hydroxymyristoyl)glucosamine N-acyltransferase n=1 Tax=Clostridium TaxID=1485 RepID=UPI00061F9FE7|nr:MULTISPECIES: UDP-3-O-(3-hydroxymyristoyl)glucosamine N-acyltransferase [Clostridium]KJZ82760.1 UDP3O3hydroxymyristoyl glucosamine Nacyltransferase [Clostridium sp. IBUN22A]KJZ87566.1 UDP-3-O-3-hydroxymyristoyl glucosamine N-acyltransferase [Clostridium sp. IBUN125C]KJZ92604.1 UDP-3-O-3-hydroxymyristoyl glucosamine N-acyltransferase [Clostridium sp. IBUN62F]KJZ97620.1 Serine phosphatase RsbU, regulator of sigma subunit [Clostridium sp. IBUN13A]MDU0322765.1 UDP-3-O-(3-hydroxymyristoyl)glucos